MSQFPNGGSAFPNEHRGMPDGTWNATFESGMTLRDWFAGHAVAPMISQVLDNTHVTDEANAAKLIATMAFEVADAMLAKRLEGGTQ